ncbi:MAG: hypothetical protein K0Q84_2325, partial [Arthrobacter sp.]|nr:hypothetical protein [Arthrobacter sp.]
AGGQEPLVEQFIACSTPEGSDEAASRLT